MGQVELHDASNGKFFLSHSIRLRDAKSWLADLLREFKAFKFRESEHSLY